jgi:hypothetical protein
MARGVRSPEARPDPDPVALARVSRQQLVTVDFIASGRPRHTHLASQETRGR